MFHIPALMSDILALSLDGAGSPSINLKIPAMHGGSHSHGWGFGWYPDDQASAMVVKDIAARGEQVLVDTITDWSNFRSSSFFCKMRGASKGYNHTQTQPFSRSYAGRDWLFVHNGDLDKALLEPLYQSQKDVFEPLGNTDSEMAFCILLGAIRGQDHRRLSDIDPSFLHHLFLRFDPMGSADMFLSDGETMICFHGSQSPKILYHTRIQPPDNQMEFFSTAASLQFNDPRDTYRTAMIISSTIFSVGDWQQMQKGQMLIIKKGEICWDSQLQQQTLLTNEGGQIMPVDAVGLMGSDIVSPNHNGQPFMQSTQMQAQQLKIDPPNTSPTPLVLNIRAVTHAPDGVPLGYRLYEVKHRTHYEYTSPVEHSTHTLRLQPFDDSMQEVVSSKLTISSPAETIQYEDVFSNHALDCIISKPYQSLTIEAISHVKIFSAPEDDLSHERRQASIPIVWMPWQRQMMMPYLMPSELPETQLTELTKYAMSFMERNDNNIIKAIENMNYSIYSDYKYVSGSTSLNTTPFEVYSSRQGVCQDFANLLICMARLLNIPARYRVGYIFTGVHYENKIQSDASHAWAELYLPYLGWRGFDPTNGCRVGQDHIRVACGRNYRDATPTTGTIYRGGGTETLSVDVNMNQIID